MAKCDNCNTYAEYIVEHSVTNAQAFCEKHLPWHINRKKLGDNIKRIADIVPTPIIESTPEVVEVEEPIVDLKPKKTNNKRANKNDKNSKNSNETGASGTEDSTLA